MNYRFVIISIFLIAATGCVRQPAAGTTSAGLSPAEANAVIDKGIKLHDQHKYAEAIGLYNSLLKKDPKNARALYEMAYSYAASHQLKKAVETADRGIRVSNDPTMLYQLKGNCLDDLGEPEKALACYRRGLKENPDESLLYYNMGLTLLHMKKYGEAEKALQHASVLNPNHPTSQLLLAQIWEAGNMRVQAVFAYMRFLFLEPAGPRAQLAVSQLRRLLFSGVTKTGTGTKINVNINGLLDKNDAYSGLNMVLSLSAALALSKENITGKTDMDKLCFQLGGLFKSMAERPVEAKDFAWKYYGDYYCSLADRKLIKAFCVTALQSMAPEEAEAWENNHREQMAALREWNRSYKFPGKGIL